MKEYIKNNKKYLIVGIYTLLILSIAHLSIYGISNSKYIDKKNYALVYQTKLNKLYQKNELAITYSKNKSTREKIYLSFKLKRNEVGIDSKLTDKYFIEIPKACDFVDDSTSEYTFPPEKNEPTIAIMCDVNDESILDNNDVFDIYVKIKEQIGKEDKFLYTDGIYSAMSKSDYLTKEFPEDIKPTKEFKISKNNNNWQQVNGDIYDELVYNLEKYYYPTYVDEVYGNFANRIKYYIQGETKENGGYIKSYKGKTSVTTSDSIPGLKITDDGNNYIFTIEENFIGYARTNVENANPYLYFSLTESLEDITKIAYYNDIFDYYLKTYLKYTNEQIEEIHNYFKSFGLNNGEIGSFILTGEPVTLQNRGIYRIDTTQVKIDNLLRYAENYLKSPVQIATQNRSNMYADFINKFENGGIYSQDGNLNYLLSESVRTVIKSNLDVAYSITTNNYDNASNKAINKQFTDYFIFYDSDIEKNDYVILKIFSDGIPYSCSIAGNEVPNCTTTYANIEQFNHNNNEVNITFKNIDDNKLEITLTDFAVSDNNEEILKLVKELDVLLNINSFNEDESFKYNEGFNTERNTLTYTIDKPLY